MARAALSTICTVSENHSRASVLLSAKALITFPFSFCFTSVQRRLRQKHFLHQPLLPLQKLRAGESFLESWQDDSMGCIPLTDLLFSSWSPAQSHVARVKVPGGSAVGGPNTKDVKQMLLDWCRVKTEPYEVGLKRQNKIKSNTVYVFLHVSGFASLPVWISRKYPGHISPQNQQKKIKNYI